MRVLAIENYPNTPLGLVGEALRSRHVDVRVVRAHEGEPVPVADNGYDGLVLLGGAQSALDDADHPYLPREVALIRSFGDAAKPVLGICLGAQLIARAYGAENILGQPIEFGWHTVRVTRAGRSDPLLGAIGPAAPFFHWHVDTFTLPAGAIRLAESDRTAIQAFRIGRATYGVQFHFEADTRLVARWNRDFAEEIEAQTPDWFGRHAAEAARSGVAADAAGTALAEAWADLVAAPSSQRAPAAKLHTSQFGSST